MKEREYIIPSNLNECLLVLDSIMTDSDKKDSEDFIKSSELNCVTQTHHGLGQWLRNNWGLWKKDSVLYKYFNKMGLWHADDMSSLIITSYHRYKNGKKINLKSQIDKNIKYWSKYQKEHGPITNE